MVNRKLLYPKLFAIGCAFFATGVVTLCLTPLFIVQPTPAPEPFKAPVFVYRELDKNNIEITGLAEESSQISQINDIKVEEKNVKSIAANAFSNNLFLKKIFIPDTIESIGERSFLGCSNLEEVILPKGLESIPRSTFRDCGSLKKINLDNGLKRIDEWAFSGCSSLISFAKNAAGINVFPTTLQYIGNSAFNGCYGFENITFYDPGSSEPELRNQLTIDTYAFDHCINVKKVFLGTVIDEIKTGAFNQNRNLSEIYFYQTDPQRISKSELARSGIKLNEDMFPGIKNIDAEIILATTCEVISVDAWKKHYHDFFDCYSPDQVKRI